MDAGAVDFATGWTAEVWDSAAIAFSTALYGALGDGRSIRDAVTIARVASGAGDQAVLAVAADQSDTDVLVIGEGYEV